MPLSESEIINFCMNSSDFIGDDCAVLPYIGKNERYVITKDLLEENIHFRSSYFDPESLAHKSLHVNLSDLVAMGATPVYILCGIAIPSNNRSYAELFLKNLIKICKGNNVILVGGDTVRSSDKLHISITAIGKCNPKNIKYIKNAKKSHSICFVGNLGYAHLGLYALENNIEIHEKYKNALLRPNAKIQEGIFLGNYSSVTAMTDISDGLYPDLLRICKTSSVMAIVETENLEPDEDFSLCCESLGVDKYNAILGGGEDYGLLFTVKNSCFYELNAAFSKAFGYEIRKIGSITVGSSVKFKKNNKLTDIDVDFFSHFN